MKHTSVALFVPHKGCPHQCSFCNQKSISGQTKSITADDVHAACAVAEKDPNLKDAQIAFFGGSFTAIEREYMTELLSAAKEHLDGEKFTGIRISTRPDAIDDEICRILKEYGVNAVELGAQSMDDKVLLLNKRGHTAEDVRKATALLKQYGFETGLQMMTGLHGSDKNESIYTAKEIIKLRPDTVRIYPTIVMDDTPLAELYRSDEYIPQTLDEATDICAELILMFYKENINVIRVGLHSGGGVEGGMLAGAFHPAFKELCQNKIYYSLMFSELSGLPKNKSYNIFVPAGALSQAMGQKKANLLKMRENGYECIIKECDSLKKYQIFVKE